MGLNGHLDLGFYNLGHHLKQRKEAMGSCRGDQIHETRFLQANQSIEKIAAIAIFECSATLLKTMEVHPGQSVGPWVLRSAPDLEPGKLEYAIQISEIPVLQEFVSKHFRQSRRYRKGYSISHSLGLETLEYG
jgi:hypothetical protein